MERKLTPEQENQLLADYRNPDITVQELSEKYGITDSCVSRYVRNAGEPLRRPKKKQSGAIKICPKCRKKIDTVGARFCPFCGSDIRSESEIIAEKIPKLTELYKFIPEENRDEYIQTLKRAAELLRKGGAK